MSADKKLHILIVEDNLVNRRLLCKYICDLGDVDVAVDGEEGVQAFNLAHEENRPYDLILLDIMMPKLDGSQALRQIRKIELSKGIQAGEGAKVVMITAVNDPKTIMQSFNDQCEGYIVKPFNRADIVAQLAKINIFLPESVSC